MLLSPTKEDGGEQARNGREKERRRIRRSKRISKKRERKRAMENTG
jgi:hypothetical protein